MVHRCVAANCSNTNEHGRSLHGWPKEPTIARQWTQFVLMKRGEWVGPTAHSKLCSDHFLATDYDQTHMQMKQMGFNMKGIVGKLEKHAVPSVHVISKVSDGANLRSDVSKSRQGKVWQLQQPRSPVGKHSRGSQGVHSHPAC